MVAAKKIIPIVLSTNDNYAKFVPVTISSILKNSDQNNFYDFYVFYSELSAESLCAIQKVPAELYKNYKITPVNVTQYTKNKRFYSVRHYSVEMWYRLFIPKILSKYPKVIYLDCDLIICSDITELYDTKLGNNYLAACRDYLDTGNSDYVSKMLGIDPEKYFNSGVLLINVEQWNKCKILDKCLKFVLTHSKLEYPDQDTLNVICRDNIKWLNGHWNFMWTRLFCLLSEKYSETYCKSEQDFRLIHYAGGRKPWLEPYLKYSNIWWQYAFATDKAWWDKYVHLMTKSEEPKKKGTNQNIKQLVQFYLFGFIPLLGTKKEF